MLLVVAHELGYISNSALLRILEMSHNLCSLQLDEQIPHLLHPAILMCYQDALFAHHFYDHSSCEGFLFVLQIHLLMVVCYYFCYPYFFDFLVLRFELPVH